jgi:hypothetical protein
MPWFVYLLIGVVVTALLVIGFLYWLSRTFQ